MIEVGYNTYKFTLFPLIILFTLLILVISRQLRSSTFPVQIPSQNAFRIYFLIGTLSWAGAFISEIALFPVSLNVNAIGYLITTMFLFLVATDHIKTPLFRNSAIAFHIALTIYFVFSRDLFQILELMSWYILLIYIFVTFFFARKAVEFKNKGYLVCALGGFLPAMMAPFQLYALYADHNAYLAFQLAYLVTPAAFIIVGLGYLTTILVNEHQLLQSMAFSDPLTETLNRRGLNHSLKPILEMNKRKNSAFSLALIDVDYFKSINDKFGHTAGDAALKQVAEIININARGADMLCRLGGDEFALVMPETNIESALMVAERIKDKISNTPVQVNNHEFNIKLSIGVVCKYGDIDLDFLIHQADIALYKSKQLGRDQVTLSEYSQ